MKNLIKNASLIGLLLLGVACKGPEGGPGMQMTSCDTAKEEVKQILTGSSQNCSGLVKAAITRGQADSLTGTYELTEITFDGVPQEEAEGELDVVNFEGSRFIKVQVLRISENRVFAFAYRSTLEDNVLASMTLSNNDETLELDAFAGIVNMKYEKTAASNLIDGIELLDEDIKIYESVQELLAAFEEAKATL